MFFGAHVSAAGGIDKAARRAADIGADAVQVFVQSPRAWRPTHHSDASIARFRELRDECNLRYAIAHAIYLINVASDKPELQERSSRALTQTMVTAEKLGLDAVVFHPGSRGKADNLDTALPLLATAIQDALAQTERVWLLVENSAGQGGTIGRSHDELAAIFAAAESPDRLGLCLDTCHWYVSGIDITQHDQLDAELDALDAAIGLDRLRCLHVNDALTELGSNRDRHANIGEGNIGSGMATVLQHPRLQGLPAILEVPGEGDGPTQQQITAVRALHGDVSA